MAGQGVRLHRCCESPPIPRGMGDSVHSIPMWGTLLRAWGATGSDDWVGGGEGIDLPLT